MKRIIPLILIAILISSCRPAQSDDNSLMLANVEMDDERVPVTRQVMNSPLPTATPPIEKNATKTKKIIKDGRIAIEVQELEKTKSSIDSLISEHEGYYANEKLNNSNWETAYILKIRIPSVHFEQLIAGIEKGSGEIKFKEINARDVTDQFIDLETRLANKKNYLKKYNDLLKQAKTVKDILEIQENVRGIEEEIESTTGRLKYLGDLVAYSTLDLEISKPKDYKYQPQKRDKLSKRLIHSLTKGWYGFVDFLVLMVNIWPFWIFAVLVFYSLKKYRKSKKAKG